MTGDDALDKVLIISSNDNATNMIASLVKEAAHCSVSLVHTGVEARRIIGGNSDYDLVIINAPISDEFGNDLAEFVSDSSMASCIMIVKSDIADSVGEKLEDYGVAVLAKPLNKTVFFQSMKMINAMRKRILGLRDQNIKLQKKIDEIRIVNRAKFALMQYLQFTEQQAHRYLEKQAMDMRKTKKEIALEIIKIYET